jgi:hypothetical protein
MLFGWVASPMAETTHTESYFTHMEWEETI